MRVVVVGASGNVGTSLLRSLSGEPRVESVLGLARRLPAARFPKVEWAAADIASSDLLPHFRGADAVVHLAWLIQPGRDEATLRATNIDGTARLLRAVAEAGVPRLVYASSVGASSPGPKDRRVDESWPTHGIGSSFYARHKAQVERMLDRFEEEHSGIRVVRLRPGLIFKREAAAGIRRLFAGPFLPGALLRPDLIPVVPRVERLVFQAVHSYDVGDAYRLAVLSDARGPFNVAAEPVLDPGELARMLDARTVPLPAAVLRGGAAAGRPRPAGVPPPHRGWGRPPPPRAPATRRRAPLPRLLLLLLGALLRLGLRIGSTRGRLGSGPIRGSALRRRAGLALSRRSRRGGRGGRGCLPRAPAEQGGVPAALRERLTRDQLGKGQDGGGDREREHRGGRHDAHREAPAPRAGGTVDVHAAGRRDARLRHGGARRLLEPLSPRSRWLGRHPPAAR